MICFTQKCKAPLRIYDQPPRRGNHLVTLFLPKQTLDIMTINVYEQYFSAEADYNGVPRHGALVTLISDSDAGQIRYEAAVTFFPHNDEDDFAVSYDAYLSKVLYEAPGRRSKKREQTLMKTFRAEIDQLAETIGGMVFWDKPLREERKG